MFDERIDLITGSGLAGKLRSQQRSVPALIDSHGKMSVGNSPGLELAAYDRSVMVLVDLVDPNRTAEVNVAGLAARMCVKAFKLAERLADGGRRLREKGAGDLLRLMMSSVPAEIAATFDTYAEHELIGVNVTAGRAYLGKALASAVSRQIAKNFYESEIDPIGWKPTSSCGRLPSRPANSLRNHATPPSGYAGTISPWQRRMRTTAIETEE